MSKVDRLICHVLSNAFLMALTASGRLVELKIVRRDRPNHIDSVFLGRLERVMPDLDAVMRGGGRCRRGLQRNVARFSLKTRNV